MTLDAKLLVHRGPFTLDAAVTVAAGETLALLGPNGSGKSTMLAAIAGLLTPDRGTVTVNGRVLTRASVSAGRVHLVPAHRRRIGLLGQDPLLFPHLSALENVAFGPRSRGIDVAVARARARKWIDAVGLNGFAERKPAELSGGQQQRIAIARVLATEPEVLLFDEPMAALDVQNASLVRTLLRERLAGRASTATERAMAAPPATIVVTHDVVDAMVLADRVAILEEGRIIDVGEVARVLGQPANLFAATLVGLNLLDGIVETPDFVRASDGRLFASAGQLPPVGTDVSVVFPPSAVALHSAHHESEPPEPVASKPAVPNSWRATVDLLEPGVRGIRIAMRSDTVVAEVSPADLLTEHVSPGRAVTASIDAAFVTVYPRRAVASAVGG